MSTAGEGAEQPRQDPAVLDYLGVLVRWRGVILRMLIVATVLMAAFSMVMPKGFRSQAIIVPTSDNTSMNVFDALSGSLLGFGFGRGSTELFLLKAMLESRTLREEIIRQFNLDRVYDVGRMDEAIQILAAHTTLTVTEDNTLKVSFNHSTRWLSFSDAAEDSVARFVQRVAAAIIERLDRLNREYQGREARDYRIFIEDRYRQIGEELADLEDRMSRFQEDHEVTAVDAQLRATLEVAAILEAEVVKRELDLAIAETTLGPDSRMIANKRSELRAAKSAFEGSFGGRDGEKRFLFGYDRDIPQLMKNYIRLKRSIGIHSEVFAFITTKYEESKLREAQNIPTISVIDYPDVPDMRYSPRRAFMVITTLVLMSVFAVLIAFVLDFVRRVRLQYPDRYRELTRWSR